MRASFKPRARLLQLLGDQLIGTPQLAIFELIKNAYDADADSVSVLITNPEDIDNASIVVTDHNGTGMDKETILNVWLEPGADHRKKSRESDQRTKKYHRLPLGEKGVGRFAVHKLGRKIELTTRTIESKELNLTIDWDDLEKCKYIDDLVIEIKENESPEVFNDGTSGTQIKISKLNAPLSKKAVRNLHRNMQSIRSPFDNQKFPGKGKKDPFYIDLVVEEHDDWLEDLIPMEDIVSQSLFRFYFTFERGKWSWSYHFCPNEQIKKNLKIEPQAAEGEDEFFEFVSRERAAHYSEDDFSDLGEISGEVYVFDFDKEVRSFYTETGAIKRFLSENQGIRIYRDGIRVYNYGEPHDDWLQMDRRRVDRLSTGLNRSITVGGISLSLQQTSNLKEKTNREGFIENETFIKLFDIVRAALSKFENLRVLDKNRLRKITKNEPGTSITNIENPIEELKNIAQQKGLTESLLPTITRIEKSYNEMRDIMLTAGMAGLNMSVAFHEISRGIKDTKRAIEKNIDKEIILQQFDRFDMLLDTYAKMLKNERIVDYQFSDLLSGIKSITEPRFFMHDIIFSCPVLAGDQKDYKVKMPPHLMTSAINNIIDNAIYWLDQRWGTKDTKNKYIYIGTSDEFELGPAIIIADSGPGWRGIRADEVVKPFHTTKPGGMGIGLYYTNTVMEMLGGELVILEANEINCPEHATGAAVALVFKEKS